MPEQATQSTSKKFPKLKRARGEKPALKIQPRDSQIIKLVYDHRFLSSDQITSLIEGSDQVILRRLQKLFHHGYLDRPPQQFSYVSGSKKMIYALGNKGADILSTEYSIDRGKINWRTKNTEAKTKYLDHSMMISNFRVCLTLALKNIPDTEIIFWSQGQMGELSDQVIIQNRAGNKINLPVNPDAFFGIRIPRGRMYFFLEADRSTMTNARFFNKTRAYWHYWKQKGHTKRYNIENFRVLTITKSDQRANNLRQVTKQADDKQKGSLMFWFASEESYNLETSATSLGPIWQTPVNENRHGILE
jgi:hypothetical protein